MTRRCYPFMHSLLTWPGEFQIGIWLQTFNYLYFIHLRAQDQLDGGPIRQVVHIPANACRNQPD
jgi:hypothetical protein